MTTIVCDEVRVRARWVSRLLFKAEPTISICKQTVSSTKQKKNEKRKTSTANNYFHTRPVTGQTHTGAYRQKITDIKILCKSSWAINRKNFRSRSGLTRGGVVSGLGFPTDRINGLEQFWFIFFKTRMLPFLTTTRRILKCFSTTHELQWNSITFFFSFSLELYTIVKINTYWYQSVLFKLKL